VTREVPATKGASLLRGILLDPRGQVEPFPNEASEERGGLVIGGWESGDGDVIATRTYDRQGPVGPGTLIERTTLELRWTR